MTADEIAIVFLWLPGLPFAVVNLAKGKIGWGICAMTGIFWLLAIGAAVRLARPDSWWARKLYDDEEQARAEERFREERIGSFETPLEDPDRHRRGGPLGFECRVCGEQFESRDVAEHYVEHAHADATAAPSAAVSELTAAG
jgi:hypothetical protein